MSCDLTYQPTPDELEIENALASADAALDRLLPSFMRADAPRMCFFCKAPCKSILLICELCHEKGAALRSYSGGLR